MFEGRKPWFRRWFGSRAERATARFLQSLGYKILARNYSCRFGELDLIALDRETVVFVEVRSTAGANAERVAASVDLKKQKRLTTLALYYLQAKQMLGRSARFDVVLVCWPEGSKIPSIEHFVQAFDAVGRGQMFN